MKTYKLVPHTADIRLWVEAETLKELFSAALSGMNEILKKDWARNLNHHTLTREIVLTSPDTTTLLIDFLSAVLTFSQEEKAVFHNFTLFEIEGGSLHAHLVGTKVEGFTTDIKAATYHEAEVKKNDKGKYETMIVFDV